MPDEIENQLEAFGRTLEQRTGEPITGGNPLVATGAPSRWGRRSWALIGAAACLVAVVVALATIRRDDSGSVASPGTTTTTIVPIGSAPFGFDTEPIVGLVGGCVAGDVVVSGEFDYVGSTYDEAVAIAERAMAEHEIPGAAPLRTSGWVEAVYGTMTVRYLDRGEGVEAMVRIVEDAGVWRVAEIAQCALVDDTPLAASVPSDPLGLERDGWTLVARSTDPFEPPTDLGCPAASGLDDLGGIEQVYDIVSPPDSNSLEVDIQILAVGSLERGNELATAVSAIGGCINESQGVEIESMALSSIRASWFRAGPDFALVTIVGDGGLSIVIEMEGDQFTDGLIAELAHRADEFLRTGQPAARPPADPVPATTVVLPASPFTVIAGESVGSVQREPDAGELKLWVSNQSFDDDPVFVSVNIDGFPIVEDEFFVEDQHNSRSWFVSRLSPGDHILWVTSDSGATFTGTITFDAGAPAWAVLDYWFETGDPRGGYFSFDESDEPILFD